MWDLITTAYQKGSADEEANKITPEQEFSLSPLSADPGHSALQLGAQEGKFPWDFALTGTPKALEGGDGYGRVNEVVCGNLTLRYAETDDGQQYLYSMKVGDAPVALKVTGGTGAYTWASDNESVATVDENGNVTAVSAGSANVTAADGTGKGTCIVRVKGTGTPNTGSSSGTLALSSTDFTLPTGDSYTLSVSGTVSSAVTWSSENSAVAAVSASGTVTGVGAGRTTIVATVNGTTLKCVVRVK